MYILGIGVLIFGVAFLLRNLGLLDFTASFWSVFYPSIIILAGLIIIAVTHEGRKLIKKVKEIFGDKANIK